MHDNLTPQSPPPEGAPAWMATFADMSTLLLTFFVLLLSFANMDVVKFKEMMGSVREALGYQTVNFGNWNPEELTVQDKESAPTAGNTSTASTARDVELQKEVQQMVAKEGLQKEVEVVASNRGVIIRVRDRTIFKPGSARLMPKAHKFLDEVVLLAMRFPHNIQVEGHTDSSPIRTKRFPTNWELSTSRAVAVLRYMMRAGSLDPGRLGAAGYADTRPIASNTSAKGRAQNRRVEFVCMRDDDPTAVESDRAAPAGKPDAAKPGAPKAD